MKKWKATYRSMTAHYDCGIYYADTKEEAEISARADAHVFTPSEKTLIHCSEVKE